MSSQSSGCWRNGQVTRYDLGEVIAAMHEKGYQIKNLYERQTVT
ncbi:MAG: hypothetical protein ABSG59_12225 [Verrucomicrobiota bacterium]